MKQIKIKVLSKAESVEGQGVGSAAYEQKKLIREYLGYKYELFEKFFGKSDLIHIHSINPSYYLKCRTTSRKKNTVIGYVHFLPETLENSIKLPRLIKKMFYWYVKSFYRGLDQLVVVNPQFIEKLVNLGIEKDRITYIPNYVNSDDFHSVSPEMRLQLREKYNIPKDKFVVLSVGQLQIRKGVLEFIQIARACPNIEFIWAGGFSFGRLTDGQAEIKQELENLPPNAHFPGIIKRELMNEIYNIADLFFLPSYSELFPMCILESMNIPIPLLLRDVDLYKPILFDFYACANNNDEFIEQIIRFSTDKEYYQFYKEKSNQGHIYYDKENVISLWDKYYLKCYQILIDNNKGKRKRRLEDKLPK